jgi:hypothetical protein
VFRGLTMTFRLAIAAATLALAACQPATPPADPAKPADAAGPVDLAAAGCDASSEIQWGPIGPSDHPSYRVRAWTHGSICEASVVTLAVFARDGFPIYTWAGQAQFLFGLQDAKDAAAMKTALAAWIDQGPELATTATLPSWEETEGQPRRAEFPFMPVAGMDKAAYETLRAGKFPTLCFPQGMESAQCLALRSDAEAGTMLEEIGLQLFPG